MSSNSAAAIALAFALIGLPLAIAAPKIWGRLSLTAVADGGAVGRRENSRRWLRIGLVLYEVLLFLGACHVVASIQRQSLERDVQLCALAVFLLSACAAGAAPWRPIAGPMAYIVLSYTLPRENAATEALMATWAAPLVTALSAIAVGLWSLSSARRETPPRSTAIWGFLLFSIWVGVAVIAAMINGYDMPDNAVHRTARMLQAVVMLVTAYYARPALGEIQALTLATASLLLVRAGLFTRELQLEQNLAALVAMLAPWTLGTAIAQRPRAARIVAGIITACLGGLVVAIANRGAFLGIAAAAAAACAASRWRRRALVAAVTVVVLASLALPYTTLGQRFKAAYQGGEFRGSAAERLELWEAALDIARQHPWFGIGPANYMQRVGQYAPHLAGIGAHNSFLDVACGMGFPGMFLFVGMWLVTTACLVRAARLTVDVRVRIMLIAAVASLWAYLAAATFLSLSTLVVIYILVGLAISLSVSSARHAVS